MDCFILTSSTNRPQTRDAMTAAYLGIDLGTGSIKALVMSRQGEVLGRGSGEYPTNHPQPGFAEQDPADWWGGCATAVREALADLADIEIAAIGLSGQMHGTMLLDGAMKLLAPAVIWADSRSSD